MHWAIKVLVPTERDAVLYSMTNAVVLDGEDRYQGVTRDTEQLAQNGSVAFVISDRAGDDTEEGIKGAGASPEGSLDCAAPKARHHYEASIKL